MSDTNNTSDWIVGNLIGFGNSWKTYEDPLDSEKVIKISELPMPEITGFTRSEVLRNLMHMVIPENIPQIFDAGLRSDQTRQLRIQKIHFHEVYARLISLKNKPELSDSERAELHNAFEAHAKWVETNERCRKLFATFEELGIAYINGTRLNVVRNPHDIPVYIDEMMLDSTIEEFAAKVKEKVSRNLDDALQVAIAQYQALPSENTQE